MSEEEFALLRQHVSGIDHCPNSNITLISGFLVVRNVLEKGCKVGLATVMGLDDIIGNFQVGKDFDAIMVDPLVENSPFDVFSTDTFPDIIQKFLFLGDDRYMIDVFVAGTRVSGRWY